MALGLLLPTPSTSAFVPFAKKPLLQQSSFHGLRLRSSLPALLPSTRARPNTSVTMMAKREEELKEIRDMPTDRINEEVVDLKGELLMLRLQKSARNEFTSSEFGRMRKRIARMLTVKREREIEEGVGKRLSRKLDRQWKRSIVVRPPPSLRKKEEQKAGEAQSSS